MVCRMFDTFSSTTQPCEYSIWKGSITVYMNLNPIEAKDACSLVPAIKQKLKVQFENGWTLRFHTPLTGNNALATCKYDPYGTPRPCPRP